MRVLLLVLLLAAVPLHAFKTLSEKDVDRISRQWDEQEEEDPDDPMVIARKNHERAPPQIIPGQPFDYDKYQADANKGKPKMLFATLKGTKKEVEEASV